MFKYGSSIKLNKVVIQCNSSIMNYDKMDSNTKKNIIS